MTLEEAIYGRRSVRKFKATSVSDEIIKDLNSGKIWSGEDLKADVALEGWRRW